jgi:Arylsulfatase regulator (Fe-S oxidoreductase)
MKILTLMLTDACNCNCTYCYQKVLRYSRLGKLGLDKIDIIDKILPEFDIIHFFGGEPLLEERFIFKFDERVNELILARKLKAKPAYIFSSNLTYLSDNLKKFLLKLRQNNDEFKFVITVDGVQAIHDRHRLMNNGESSYECIIKNYEFLVKNNMNVETIYVVYNYSHFNNGITLKDCIENINNNFRKVRYIAFNNEAFSEETKISDETFFELKYDMLKSIFEDIQSKENKLKFCRPFLLQELQNIFSSIIAPDSESVKCILDKQKFSIMPNGEGYMCVDHYYYHERPVASLDNADELKSACVKYSLENNIKPTECQGCEIKIFCRTCPAKKENINEICMQNKKYYGMVLFYLKKIFANKQVLRNFIEYADVPKEMIVRFHVLLLNKNSILPDC